MLILIVIDVHIYRKLFLALKEVRMVKITPQNPPAKFVIPPPPQSLNAIWKTLHIVKWLNKIATDEIVSKKR